MCRRAAPALVAASLAAPATAWGAGAPERGAEPGRSARLQWQRVAGAEGCISGEELAATLQRRLRRGTIGGPEAELTLEGTVAPAERGVGWKAWVVVRDRADRSAGAREVATDEASCRALDEALLLVLSVIIDPSAAFEPGPAPAAAAGGRRPGDGQATTWHLAAGAGAALGLVPRIGLGAAASAGLRLWGGPVLELEAAHWFGTRVERAAGGATVAATQGGVNVCWLPFERGAWQAGGCLGVQGGVVSADAAGFGGENLAPSRPLANVAARGEARLRLADPFFVRLTLGAALPLVRDRFFFESRAGEPSSLFRLSPAIGALGLQGGVTFR